MVMATMDVDSYGDFFGARTLRLRSWTASRNIIRKSITALNYSNSPWAFRLAFFQYPHDGNIHSIAFLWKP
jgi:hypothetical protein